ncbi:MAG: VOC family protein [Bryobacteraceae bacterium]
MVQGIEHTALASPDPEKLAQWYVEHLGFAIVSHSPASKTTFVKAPNGFMLEIITSNGIPRGEQQLRDIGLRHLAIAVSDFDSVYGSLKARGVNFISEPETAKGNRLVFFTDPDGNYLHLLQRAQPLA